MECMLVTRNFNGRQTNDHLSQFDTTSKVSCAFRRVQSTVELIRVHAQGFSSPFRHITLTVFDNLSVSLFIATLRDPKAVCAVAKI